MSATSRAQKAAEMDSAVNQTLDGKLAVDSEGGDDRYVVDLEAATCTCMDHQIRGTTCKHMHKAAEAVGLYSLTREQ